MQFQERLFCIFQRELSTCIYAEKSGFKMHLLLYAQLCCSFVRIAALAAPPFQG